jgi:hypothetical protein
MRTVVLEARSPRTARRGKREGRAVATLYRIAVGEREPRSVSERPHAAQFAPPVFHGLGRLSLADPVARTAASRRRGPPQRATAKDQIYTNSDRRQNEECRRGTRAPVGERASARCAVRPPVVHELGRLSLTDPVARATAHSHPGPTGKGHLERSDLHQLGSASE